MTAKPKKEWRDPEGSIIRRTVRRRDSKGKLKDVEVIYTRIRYTDRDGKRREKKRIADSFADAVIASRRKPIRRRANSLRFTAELARLRRASLAAAD